MRRLAPRPVLDTFLPREPTMRLLAVTTLVTTFGSGLFYTTSALFFTRIVGLSVAQVGVGLTIAGLCGVLAGLPFGHLADRRGARRLLVVLLVLEGLATLAFVAVDSFAAFVLVASAAAVCDRGGSTVRNALIALAVPEGERVHGRALLRSLTNVGIGCGTAVAALALHFDSRPAYVTLIVADTCAFMVAAALLTRLPRATADARAPQAEGGPRLLALRDRPYLAVTVLFGLVSFQFGIFEIGLPIWVAEHTSAPRTVVAAALLVNTALIVCLQVRASRGTEEAPGAARACAWSGLLLGGACVLYAAAAELPAARRRRAAADRRRRADRRRAPVLGRRLGPQLRARAARGAGPVPGRLQQRLRGGDHALAAGRDAAAADARLVGLDRARRPVRGLRRGAGARHPLGGADASYSAARDRRGRRRAARGRASCSGCAVRGWRALGCWPASRPSARVALQVAGEQPAAALALGWVAMLVEGCAEPENAGWCACRLPRGRGAACRRRVSS